MKSPEMGAADADRRNIVLTGLARSGTTLTCHLLNKLPDTVALTEPISPGKFVDLLPDYEAVAGGVEEFYARMRRMALEDGEVISKHVGGEVPDNSFGRPDASGERKSVLEKGRIPVGKPLPGDFYLVVKQPGLFTALLPTLAPRLPCYAIIRNPLSVLASRTSLGRSPGRHPTDRLSAVQRYDEDLGRRMACVPRGTLEWRLNMMSHSFERFQNELPDEHVIRYEDIVATGGRALSAVVPTAGALDEPLESKNLNPLYDREEMLDLGEKLLASEGAYWDFYSRESVEELLGQIA
jgi:hypothetical protein